MKHITTVAVGLLAAVCTLAQGIQFEETLLWNEIQAKAKAEKKYIFIDAMATWCGPCKAMDQNVYPNAAVGEFFNANFISIKLQTDQTPSDPEPVKKWYPFVNELASTYKVSALPSLIFLTPDGKLASKIAGYREAEALISDAKQAMQPDNQYWNLIEQYAAGKKDAAFIENLATQAEQIGRKITADKIRGVDAFAAYPVKPVTVAGGFAGSWSIDYPRCDFGSLPLSVGSKEVSVEVSASTLVISRLATGNNGQPYTATENISLDGKFTDNPSKTSNRIKKSRIAAGQNKESFIELSEYTFPNSKVEIDFLITEEWKLSDNGKSLTIIKTVNDGQKPYTVTLVYNKK